MKLKDPQEWIRLKTINVDSYGSGVIRYSERWADMMEQRISRGENIANCAYETSHLADTEGITGFMFGCSVGALAKVWQHGEELRRWHNLKTQIGNEGERANESGDVLNPALLRIG